MGEILGKFEPTTRASKIRLQKIFANSELDEVTRDPKYGIVDLGLLWGDL